MLAKVVPFTIRQHCGPKLASLLRYSVTYDERDNPVFPSQGILIKANTEYSGFGGNISYLMYNGHAELNVPLFSGIVAQTCLRGGVIKPTRSVFDLPISNLFYCGGPQTLRGFEFGGAGPKTEGTPIGANVRSIIEQKITIILTTSKLSIFFRLTGRQVLIYGLHYHLVVYLKD